MNETLKSKKKLMSSIRSDRPQSAVPLRQEKTFLTDVTDMAEHKVDMTDHKQQLRLEANKEVATPTVPSATRTCKPVHKKDRSTDKDNFDLTTDQFMEFNRYVG